MGKPVEIVRTDASVADLRHAGSRTRDGRLSCRLLAIALVMKGATRAEAAAAGGMDRQTLCDWVHRYNAAGMAGLVDHPRRGRPGSLSTAQMQELKELVLAGPVPVWQYLRGHKLSHRVWDSYDAVLAACKDAWNTLIADTTRVRSITQRCWAAVKI